MFEKELILIASVVSNCCNVTSMFTVYLFKQIFVLIPPGLLFVG